MRKYFLLTLTLLISGTLFAYPANNQLSDHLSAAWKKTQHLKATQDANDITMVYGGKDVSIKPTALENILLS